LKLFSPEIFQGSYKKKQYFEGWYYKHVSADENHVYAFIPGISISEKDPHSFIQVISGLTGESYYISYPIEAFRWKKDRLYVEIEGCTFTQQYIELNIDRPELKIGGRLNYDELSPLPKSWKAPGIMGWYSYVPFMECYHGVVSANHGISGELNINGQAINFDKGRGYIEKDWGTSFPECWIWVQSNSFRNEDASLFFSVAKIPWLGSFFIGFIAFIYLDGEYYKFATYNKSRLVKVNKSDRKLAIELHNKKYKLSIDVIVNNSSELIAPSRGSMIRRIKESIDSEVNVKLTSADGLIKYTDSAKRAGLEIIDKIFDYL
jgi:hypothetical protein